MNEPPSALTTERREYLSLLREIRGIVAQTVPLGVTVAVISGGDEEPLKLGLRETRHLPEEEHGWWAGYHPGDSAEAIDQLETLRERGAQYLVVPGPSLWWFAEYPGLRSHLERYRLLWEDERCAVFELDGAQALAGSPPASEPAPPLIADEWPPPSLHGHPREIDVERTRLHERFFSRFEVDSPEELLREVAATELELEQVAGADRLGYSGWAYWFFYLKGYVQYLESGTVGSGNAYYEYVRRYSLSPVRDPGLSDELANPFTVIERIARRFRDLDYFHKPGVNNRVGMYAPAPVRLFFTDPPPKHPLLVYEFGSDEPLAVARIDGHHRLFAARFFGAVEFRFQALEDPQKLPHVLGALEHFSVENGAVHARGWCLLPDREVESVELRLGGASLARAPVAERPDVLERFPDTPHAYRSGFDLVAPADLPASETVRVSVVPWSDWAPVGALTACHVPDGRESDWQAAKLLDELLDPVALHRSPDSFESVLVVDSKPPLERLAEAFLPRARVTCVRADEVAALADESFDLVLAPFVLAGLEPEGQEALLDELHKVSRDSALLALSVLGELMRPFLEQTRLGAELDAHGIARATRTYQTEAWTRERCAERFQTLDYVRGGVGDEQDLVILGKR